MLVLMKLFHTKEYVFPADVKCKDQCGTNPHCKLLIGLYCGTEFAFFYFKSIRKGKLCVFRGCGIFLHYWICVFLHIYVFVMMVVM